MAAGGVVLNFILNYFLIQSEGAEGAAKASMVTQGLTALAQIFLAIKILKIKIEYKEIIRMLIFIVGVAALSKAFCFDNWIYNILLFFVCGGIWVLVSGMVQPKQALTILKTRE